MKVALAALLLSLGLGAQQASIEGVTVNSETHEPVPGVHVSLVAATFNGITASYGAISDRAGHFSIASIRPGTYIVLPERSGYLFAAKRSSLAGIPNVPLRAGQQLTGFQVELMPRAIVAGRVVDDHGDPVQGVTVDAVAVDEKEQPNFLVRQPTVPTDDRGEFRIATIAGRYYVECKVSGVNNQEKPEVRDGAVLANYRTTYYPSSVAKNRATAVEAVGGKETGGLEIRLSRQAGISISGIVRGAPDPSVRPNIVMQWGPTAESFNSSTSVSVDAEGRFTIPDAQNAYYRAYAFWYGKPPMISRPSEFHVTESDVANLEFTLGPAPEVSGVVEVEGEPPGANAPKRTVRLDGINSFSPMRPTGGDTDAKGAFSLTGLAPNKYRVVVSPLPENGYVKKVVVDGTEAPNGVVDLTAASRSSAIKVTVARDGAQVTGRVLDENGERLLTPLAIVLLAPLPLPASLTSETTAQTQPDGTYSFKSLRPGKYRILAVDPFRTTGSNLSDMSKLLETGEEIELQPGARLERNVRTQPKEDANAKPKQ
jgi:hypothetical protein